MARATLSMGRMLSLDDSGDLVIRWRLCWHVGAVVGARAGGWLETAGTWGQHPHQHQRSPCHGWRGDRGGRASESRGKGPRAWRCG